MVSKKISLKKKLIALFMCQLVFLLSGSLILTKADDLVIKDDGEVILIVTNDGGVLAATSAPQATQEPSQPKTTAPAPTPVKVIPIAPAHVENTVQVNPPTNNDKKVQVTITKPITSKTPSNVIVKTVDKVVAQGANGQPIVSIKSNKANEVTVQQDETNVSTSMPVQINTATHAISVVTPNGDSTKVSVLPEEAVHGVTQQGLITTNPTDAKNTLTQESGHIIYNIQGEKSGKIFGLININSPVSVKISAENGKVVKTTQSPLLSIFGFLIR